MIGFVDDGGVVSLSRVGQRILPRIDRAREALLGRG